MSSVKHALTRKPSVPSIGFVSSKLPAIHSILGILPVAFLSLNLRPLPTSVAPLLHDIQADLGLSNFWVSVLMTVPVVCLGMFGPLAAPLSLAAPGTMNARPGRGLGGAGPTFVTANLSALSCIHHLNRSAWIPVRSNRTSSSPIRR